ncbi:MAG: DUF1402 family protein [Pseudomonadota bacterium]
MVQGTLAKNAAATIMLVGVSAAVFFTQPGSASERIIAVEPGNTLEEQPDIPSASKRRTRQTNSTFERKYQRALDFLAADARLIGQIKSTAEKFDIDPIHIIGAIIGEHTYNVDVMDRAQSYVIKAANYLNQDIDFEFDGVNVLDFVEREEFDRCSAFEDSESLWICRENVWDTDFRGKTVDETTYPNNRFSAAFFQPFFAGQTFGLGQLNPLTALKMTDRVVTRVGGRQLSADDGQRLYETIMDPKTTLPYIAATIASSIEAYENIAGFDISANPGITATLYNVGNSRVRAAALAAKNKQRRAQGRSRLLPQVNYYGWLINDREAELRDLL